MMLLLRHGGFRFFFLLLLLPLLLVVIGPTTAARPSRDKAGATVQTDCVLGQDGTCLVTEDATTTASEDDTTHNDDNDDKDDDIPPEVYNTIPLPPINQEHLIDVGHGEPQLVTGEQAVATKLRLQRMLYYFQTVVHNDNDDNDNNNNNKNKFSPQVREECQNRNQNCAFWASIGECTANPAYMLLTCAAACLSCEQLDFHHRCPMPEDNVIREMNVWNHPGQLEDMFARIVNDYKDQVTILSRPGTPHDVTGEGAWVVQLDDFLTHEECDRLIELGTQRGYEQSKDVGERKFDGTYDSKEDSGRTSKNTWCLDECYDDPATKSVLQKIEDLTGIPDIHSEYLQLLRYEEGQFYNQHHDYIPHHIDRPSGPRILTVFLYLNTVEEGGGTYFNDLEITCQPQKGRAVIWPSVLDKAPDQKDHRTHHEALPVIKGVKYGANAWIHLRDFKTPYKQGCI